MRTRLAHKGLIVFLCAVAGAGCGSKETAAPAVSKEDPVAVTVTLA